ncbi:MAG TPA: RibD family protein [Methanotrichaceae archaeon]|nr:RibD family protein [Methanotrichaceae archaeon]
MLPRVILHNALSVDGRYDWLKPDLAQFYGQASRWKEDATLAGSDTMIAALGDMPADDLDVPAPQIEIDPEDKRALLIVPDSRGRIRCWNQVRKWPYWRDVVVLCSGSTPEDYLDYLQKVHVDHIIAGHGQVDLKAALEEINARYGIEMVRVDSGGALNGVLLRSGLVDEVSVMIEPCLVGGMTPCSIFRAPDLTSDEGSIPLRLIQMEKLKGEAVWLYYEVVK